MARMASVCPSEATGRGAPCLRPVVADDRTGPVRDGAPTRISARQQRRGGGSGGGNTCLEPGSGCGGSASSQVICAATALPDTPTAAWAFGGSLVLPWRPSCTPASLEPIYEDEPLRQRSAGDSDDGGDAEEDSRSVTPMFIPGIRDHVTMEEATARAKRRHRRAFAFSGPATASPAVPGKALL
mmetsp:Transcript_36147/g.90975  ORF Transcript_36147/g.90975 Transcript_36147/m.90975 type:complete len:184 (-) Transcript_36147:156-707(-)